MQNYFKKQAFILVNNLKLNEMLLKFGDFRTAGSVVYNLMTWRDIDIDLITPTLPDNKVYWEIAQYIFSVSEVKKLTLVDNRELEEKDIPKSMYIGVNYKDSENEVKDLNGFEKYLATIGKFL